jgi:two-component SAPR family response regulator
LPDRLAVLDVDSAAAMMATLKEAHTGDRSFVSPPDRVVAKVPHSSDSDEPSSIPADGALLVDDPVADQDQSLTAAVSTPDAQVKASLRVFGTPQITNISADGRPLRAKAAELAVYLACHPDGADIRTIGEHLEPDLRLRQSDQHVHTNVSNLRHVLGRAAGFRKVGYVIKVNGRYRLDRDSVYVDLWRLQDLLAQAKTSESVERIDLLREACDLYTAPLADDCDYDWVEPHRERARQVVVDAHTLLAEVLSESAPKEAVEVLDRAITIDRYNEALYRQAMRARHCVGDHIGVRVLFRTLQAALADLDVEPDEVTRVLFKELSCRTH